MSRSRALPGRRTARPPPSGSSSRPHRPVQRPRSSAGEIFDRLGPAARRGWPARPRLPAACPARRHRTRRSARVPAGPAVALAHRARRHLRRGRPRARSRADRARGSTDEHGRTPTTSSGRRPDCDSLRRSGHACSRGARTSWRRSWTSSRARTGPWGPRRPRHPSSRSGCHPDRRHFADHAARARGGDHGTHRRAPVDG